MEEETSSKKYEVFLSFRGVDTRNNFTSHLYKALRDRCVETFMDDPDLRKGDEISQALFNAIEESYISLIVFSKRYASSRWCIEELVKILQCKKHGQIVIPVFYEVEPTDVRNQTGSYAEAFAKFEASKKHLDKLQTWKDALKEAANHSGYSSLETKPEALLVEKVVQEVSERLSMVCSHDNKGLIGIDSRINEIEEFLVSKDVRSVGIWGAGGMGKTTLAKVVFDKISYQFESSCFLRNVRGKWEKGGLDELEREFYGKITRDKCIPNRDYAFENRILKSKKLLIVFDDVTNIQLVKDWIKDLISKKGLHSRSRVIVTSRDSQVLKNCVVDVMYKMEALSDKDAIELFWRHALEGNPPMWAYQLSWKFVNRLGCLPLALKVVGSSLQNKGEKFWESSLSKLKKVLPHQIHEVLKISYDGLEDDQQKIFLDIVYFFEGGHKDEICAYLSYYESVEVEIEVLIDKSLIVKLDDNRIIIHDLLQDMGRMIERKQHVRTRLSSLEDIRHHTNSQVIGISLDMSGINAIYLNFSTFSDIKILDFYSSYCPIKDKERDDNKVFMLEGCDFVLNALKKLNWLGGPLKSFPSKFHPEHLVTLSMRDSKLEKLWDGALHFPQLTEIDLSCSKHLTTCPDLSGAPNLVELNFNYCESLICIPDCFAGLTSLGNLYMRGCSSLQSLHELSGLESLEILILSDCASLVMLPELPSNITLIQLQNTAIEELPPAFENLIKLWSLSLEGCSKIHKLHDKIGTLESLHELVVSGTAIRDVPPSFGNLTCLRQVSFSGCKFEGSMNSLMDALSGSCSTLTKLYLVDCGIMAIPDSLGRLSKLLYLYLNQNHLESIPASIINLSDLMELDVGNCKKLQCLPKLQCRTINAANCSSLKWVDKLSDPDNFGSAYCFNNCVKLGLDVVEDFLQTLQSLVEDFHQIQQFPPAPWTPGKLHSNDAKCRDFTRSCLIYPGSMIPKWFIYQCTGSFITLKLPRKEEGKIFVGFVVCVVLDVNINSLKCEYTLKSKDGQGRTFLCYLSFPEKFIGVKDVGSDHLYIGCSHCMDHVGDLCYDTEVTIKFWFSNNWLEYGINGHDLKSCGVRPMYAENLGNSSGSLNLSETESEPHPKRLKINTNS